MSKSELSVAIQDYLKEIYKIQASGRRGDDDGDCEAHGRRAFIRDVDAQEARRARPRRARPYRGVELSEAGTKIALEIIRHHRLLEQYLAETLGTEHRRGARGGRPARARALRELEARIDEQLGYPTHDPHGDPIPDAGLNVDRSPLRSLEALEPGEEATVRRVPDGDADLLRYLAKLALVPGGRVTMRRSSRSAGRSPCS